MTLRRITRLTGPLPVARVNDCAERRSIVYGIARSPIGIGILVIVVPIKVGVIALVEFSLGDVPNERLAVGVCLFNKA